MKNRRTLQRMLGAGTTQGDDRGSVKEGSSGTMQRSQDEHLADDDAMSWTGSPSRSLSPADPHNLMTLIENGRQVNPAKLTRKLLNSMGQQFPIGKCRDKTLDPREARDYPHPMVSIASLAKRGWNLHHVPGKRQREVPGLPVVQLPPEDAELLRRWTPSALQDVIRDRTLYFEHGIHGSKRDAAPSLDPVHRGLISEHGAQELVEAYFEYVHPQIAVLDPCLHTLRFTRSRSALLTTTILAIGATAIATLPDFTTEQVAIARTLHTHCEKLQLVVYATGAKSVDIIQAFILLASYGLTVPTRLDVQSSIRMATAARMAHEIGLHLSRYGNAVDDEGDNDEAQRLLLNDLRARAFLISFEYRYYTYTGSESSAMSRFELTDSELEKISEITGYDADCTVPAFYQLYLFERDTRNRLERVSDLEGFQAGLTLESEMIAIQSFVDRWIAKWCPVDGDTKRNWHLVHEVLATQLLLLARIARNRTKAPDYGAIQTRLLETSVHMFTEALRQPGLTHMTHRPSTFPFAAAIILKLSPNRDIVLRIALRLAGPPDRPHIPQNIRNAGYEILALLCGTPSLPQPLGTHRAMPERMTEPPAWADTDKLDDGIVNHIPAINQSDNIEGVVDQEDWDHLLFGANLPEPAQADPWLADDLFSFETDFGFTYAPSLSTSHRISADLNQGGGVPAAQDQFAVQTSSTLHLAQDGSSLFPANPGAGPYDFFPDLLGMLSQGCSQI